MKGSVKHQWDKLTEDDLNFVSGQREKLITKLQERYGFAREEAQRRADEWLKTAHEPDFAHSGASTPQRGSEPPNRR